MKRPETVSELKDSGLGAGTVKNEIRKNLIARIRSGERLFPGIIGLEDTVIPQIENAILSGQDIVLLGERGQAKTRLMRALISLLDEYIPVLAGCEIRDDPLSPICDRCKKMLADMGPDTPIDWVHREHRYNEKLATPDVTIADLIGEVDPIKIAEGRYLSDSGAIHFGLIPRSNRGIFALNELPDLAEKIQVGLFNVLEERDVQIRGFSFRLPLDVYFIASANPEDYTNRGRIITPLKDRFGSQVRTHYPLFREDEITIMEQERRTFPEEADMDVPSYMKEIVAEISRQARIHSEIDQRSGVSVRVSIHNMENVLSNALRRHFRLGEGSAVPRITDLEFISASTMGKIEIEGFGDALGESLLQELVDRAVANVFEAYWNGYDFRPFLGNFRDSNGVVVSEMMLGSEYERQSVRFEGLDDIHARLEAGTPEQKASSLEFVLEGLRIRGELEKEKMDDTVRYRARHS
ncbi:MAG: sigma 54-interacting transcriptional regulator [Deltaproteobacteria bacterium]|nr:sigma 54-interacting transcriptional regulator [Deltaproteobacteria bacterium]